MLSIQELKSGIEGSLSVYVEKRGRQNFCVEVYFPIHRYIFIKQKFADFSSDSFLKCFKRAS